MTRLRAWLDGMSDVEKVLYPGLSLVAIGFALIWIPLGLVVPGGVLIFIALRGSAGGAATLADLEEAE